ncbi:hypothetical protein J26TS2_09070 [Shouchella clausii]|nr:hypothetical protein J26TS2_09070 [Shouchella clausii]
MPEIEANSQVYDRLLDTLIRTNTRIQEKRAKLNTGNKSKFKTFHASAMQGLF